MEYSFNSVFKKCFPINPQQYTKIFIKPWFFFNFHKHRSVYHLCSLHRSERCSGILTLCPHTPRTVHPDLWPELQAPVVVSSFPVLCPCCLSPARAAPHLLGMEAPDTVGCTGMLGYTVESWGVRTQRPACLLDCSAAGCREKPVDQDPGMNIPTDPPAHLWKMKPSYCVIMPFIYLKYGTMGCVKGG